MATRGRPPSPERRYLDPAFQRKLWLNLDRSPYRQRRGRTPGFLTLPNGLKCDMVHVIGMAEYFFFEAKERGKRITKKTAFEKGIEEILADNGLRQSSAKRLAETAMRIHRTMVHDLGLLPIS